MLAGNSVFGRDSSDSPMTATADTPLAPAERATRAALDASIANLTRHPLVHALLDAADVCVVILNQQRQILVGNTALLTGLGITEIEALRGLRPGEALGCVHARACPGGCGTSPQCAACGAVLAILESQQTHNPVERECLLTVNRGGAMEGVELKVRACQVELGNESFTVLGLRDISAEKRREALERVFLHDLSNTLSPLLTWAKVLSTGKSRDPGVTAQRIATLALRLQREIENQRLLLQAENGTLQLQLTAVEPQAILAEAIAIVEADPEANDRSIELRPPSSVRAIITDESLLLRVLVNMLKNALEATLPGGRIEASAEAATNGCEFRVWNAGAIPPRVALQVFKRSFSTKGGHGRGLGTFSMKLLGERYLGGVVGFGSSECDGTTFFVRLPSL